MTKQRIYAYVGSIRRFIEEGDRDKATKALETFRDYLLGQTAGTMQEEYEKQQIINKVNPPLVDTDNDMVNNPSHYQSMVGDLNIDCITAMRAAFGNYETAVFCKLNAFKYVWRASSKNGNEDIDKASWYLNKFKELGGENQ